MAALTFVEPEDPLGAKHLGWQLVVEKILKFAQGERPLRRKRQRGESLDGGVVGVISVIVMIVLVMIVVVITVIVVLVFAVAVVVIAGAVVWLGAELLLGNNFVAFEQSHAEQ